MFGQIVLCAAIVGCVFGAAVARQTIPTYRPHFAAQDWSSLESISVDRRSPAFYARVSAHICCHFRRSCTVIVPQSDKWTIVVLAK